MNQNFEIFKKEIQQCLFSMDVNYFITDLRDLFNDESIKLMSDCDRIEKCDTFLAAFERLDNSDKYHRLMISAENHNKWIHSFLSTNLSDTSEIHKLNARWEVMNNLLDLLRHSRSTLCVMDSNMIDSLYHYETFSRASRDYLKRCLELYGAETALFDLFNVVSLNNLDWYGIIVCVIAKQDTAFFQILKEYMDVSEHPSEEQIKEYVNKWVEKLMIQYQMENIMPVPTNIDHQLAAPVDEACSDYGGSDECSIDGDITLELANDSTNEDVIEQEVLTLKDFQFELTEVALTGQNVIIYAPTGTGKTVVAVHIANKHLQANPNGKIAFLVPRTPLVTQQYRMFEKFKDPQYNVIEMRGKGESVIGPLIAHIDSYQVFVMTSDILRNALTFDDGNKLESITQFSLIFFDECHNCMKAHPYTKIMKEYFKEKKDNPNKKLPQIVGLTASPRSNKKDDLVGMQKSLFELCANLDCANFSMVKKHIHQLEEEMNQPKQQVIKIGRRKFDAFEATLLEVMSYCEQKLAKMKRENYFPSWVIKTIPDDKFKEDYVGFVGNLEKLNTLTISDNDGKQKAYCIFRYLNAYYRGLIVNQMFNELYARHTIDKYLKHNGVDFTCCYDEEFYQLYQDRVSALEQSENPSIESIKSLITDQLEQKPDSRILIFVRQVDYTYFLVDELKKNNCFEVEAIVGSNTKNLLKGCTISEMREILVRFTKGDTKVLVATTVVEEGLDVGLCNMVISYGHVTNETALIQRRGRARSSDSRYILILPPMLGWMEKKELQNERRKDKMMDLISKFGQMNLEKTHMNLFIMDYQQRNFFITKKVPTVTNDNKVLWNFRCKICQEFVCTSEELRIVENMHRVIIDPKVLTTFKISRRELKSFGSQGNYQIGGVMQCKCLNNDLGNFMFYKKIPYFQLSILTCNVVCLDAKSTDMKEHSFKKWKDFAKHYDIAVLTTEELLEYCNQVMTMDIPLEGLIE